MHQRLAFPKQNKDPTWYCRYNFRKDDLIESLRKHQTLSRIQHCYIAMHTKVARKCRSSAYQLRVQVLYILKLVVTSGDTLRQANELYAAI